MLVSNRDGVLKDVTPVQQLGVFFVLKDKLTGLENNVPYCCNDMQDVKNHLAEILPEADLDTYNIVITKFTHIPSFH